MLLAEPSQDPEPAGARERTSRYSTVPKISSAAETGSSENS